MIGSNTERHNLDNLVIMGLDHDIILVPLLEPHDKEVAGAHGTYQEVALFARHAHVVQRHVRFVGVTAALQLIVPDLHRLVVSTSHEFCLANLGQVRDIALVSPFVLEGLLHDDD